MASKPAGFRFPAFPRVPLVEHRAVIEIDREDRRLGERIGIGEPCEMAYVPAVRLVAVNTKDEAALARSRGRPASGRPRTRGDRVDLEGIAKVHRSGLASG